MKIYITIFLINLLVWIYVSEPISKVLPQLIWKKLYPNIRYNENFLAQPLRCQCLGFWISLFYIIIAGQFTIVNLVIIGLTYKVWPLFTNVYNLVYDCIQNIINKLYNFLIK